MKQWFLATCVTVFLVGFGCDKPASNTAAPAPTPGPASQPKPSDGDHPNRIPLGETSAAGLKFVATQDEPIKPGGEGAFDLVITGGAKPKAVRFWVGTEDARGSVKAKAEEETPDNWHTHAEVPDPLPEGSKFWAEIEPASGEQVKVSFELKK